MLRNITGAAKSRLETGAMTRFIVAAALLAGGLIAGGETSREFFDLPSLLITLGGALSVTLMTFSWAQLQDLARLVWRLRTGSEENLAGMTGELRRLARLYHLNGPRGLESREPAIADPFLRRGVMMLIDVESEEEIRAKLESEALFSAGRYATAEQILLTLGKLLPAFGLIGTLIGLVLLLKQIPGEDSQSLIPSFSLAILTTLYGALAANVVVLPLAARLQSAWQRREAVMILAAEWVIAIARGDAPAAIERRLGALHAGGGQNESGEPSWSRTTLFEER